MELFTGYQAYQSSLNQAHDLSLLAPTIQADALKKRAIQANASAWIGLIVDNYAKHVDLSLWLHLYAFDSLGEISSSRRFGFLDGGKDVGDMIEKVDKIYHMTGLVKARLEKPTTDPDLLNGTLKIREHDPSKLSVDEVVSSMYINLIAGQHVLAITLRALVYYLAKTPSCVEKLREEFAAVDVEYPRPSMIPFSKLSKLPYLEATIYESLRVHTNTGLMLERVIPAEGATIDGYFLPGGTVVGVNAWALHHNNQVFGDHVKSFRPGRWLEASAEEVATMKSTMFSFGDGPRKCIGQHIAVAQLSKLLVEFLREYDVRLKDPLKEWHVHGSWVTRQSDMDMVVSRLCRYDDLDKNLG
ncbi:cytochrome P450 [Byssothecium circinans]|uniref:Cytochrome P450 n=1 Tax=Byssothecium circinans TaxID=147558 RepID=A0A6A5TYS6_9PLEO|nr:cytochrome P450 [Byssothecium circinans]